MSFTLNDIVPWGRSFEEYRSYFSLTDEDLNGSILGCADGPASFNAVFTANAIHSAGGGSVVSADPLYRFSAEEIRMRIDETFGEIIGSLERNKEDFVWRDIPSVKALGEKRMEAMELFLGDYARGLREGRYVDASLPTLPFKDNEFDLALSSHLLFLYSGHLSEDFHVDSIRELCRVAREVRIFPLLQLNTATSVHLNSVMERLEEADFSLEIIKVDYEFQRGGSRLLKVKGPSGWS